MINAKQQPPQYYIRQHEDKPNSWAVFDRTHVNEWDEHWCEEPYLTYDQAREVCDKLNAGKKSWEIEL